ncbi:hypothetical protein [Sphingobium baderi]|uniref:hypothetical protein n=1 Tax=Sphingobium baderi TaxID=1332080 RepID=UPI002B413B5D|nr:hypothetical protein [Sphingobium baderi]WRD75276.1 hypothetical protein QQ987_10745 [Sphingobium baderi]
MNKEKAVRILQKVPHGEVREAVLFMIRDHNDRVGMLDRRASRLQQSIETLNLHNQRLQQEIFWLGQYALDQWAKTDNASYASFIRSKLDDELDYIITGELRPDDTEKLKGGED